MTIQQKNYLLTAIAVVLFIVNFTVYLIARRYQWVHYFTTIMLLQTFFAFWYYKNKKGLVVTGTFIVIAIICREIIPIFLTILGVP